MDGDERLKKRSFCIYSVGVLVMIQFFLRCPGLKKPTTYLPIAIILTIHSFDPLLDQS